MRAYDLVHMRPQGRHRHGDRVATAKQLVPLPSIDGQFRQIVALPPHVLNDITCSPIAVGEAVRSER